MSHPIANIWFGPTASQGMVNRIGKAIFNFQDNYLWRRVRAEAGWQIRRTFNPRAQ